ncbi:hypothetical protein ACQEWB_40185 [Streptomyces sp. CA-249302]|uniref:hypothetical protein n=1 Tax=Streptomyces sp. CA-249302 TaxID=3240058 RepID=UPI003D8AA9A0
MAVDQLPGRVREFANYLNGLVARLDQGGGWCAVFWQRDPDGMRACLEGREVPPWDVVEALLQDLTAEYGPAAVTEEPNRARALHAAALTAYDARPGARDALGDRLDVMLREQRYAAERQAELARMLTTATTRHEADTIRLDLAWAHDDHERATARCAELRGRIAGLDRRASGDQATAIRRGRLSEGAVYRIDREYAETEAPPGGTGPGRSGGGAAEPARPGGHDAGFAQRGGSYDPAVMQGARGGYEAGGRESRAPVDSYDSYGHDAADARRGQEPSAAWRGPFETAAPSPHQPVAPEFQGTSQATASGRTLHPSAPAQQHPAAARTAPVQPGSAIPGHPAQTRPAQQYPDPAPTTPVRQASTSPAHQASTTLGQPAPTGPAPHHTAVPAPEPPAPKKRKRRGSARFAGMVEEDVAPVVVPPTAGPVLPAPAADNGRTPRGARFAGAAEATERAEPVVEVLDAEGAREVAGAVERLVRLRAEGRSGEAHALLVEAAYWGAARFPLLAVELQRAGLGADWATLLWEAASLPAGRLVAAADALVAAGRGADGEQILRQGVARPAGEIGRAVLELAGEGRRREVRSLLDAYVRVRTPEEAARSAEPDPQALVPLLLEAARGVSEERHWDLVHALRVAGFAA